jgi:hypothetical protein
MLTNFAYLSGTGAADERAYMRTKKGGVEMFWLFADGTNIPPMPSASGAIASNIKRSFTRPVGLFCLSNFLTIPTKHSKTPLLYDCFNY